VSGCELSYLARYMGYDLKDFSRISSVVFKMLSVHLKLEDGKEW